MIYYIRFDTDRGYDNKSFINRQHWSLWFASNGSDGPYQLGYCHSHPNDLYKSGSYYLFGDKRQGIY